MHLKHSIRTRVMAIKGAVHGEYIDVLPQVPVSTVV